MKYLQIQFKKMLQLLPVMLFVSVLTILALAAAVFLLKQSFQNENGDTAKLGVGVVGDIDSSYLNFGINVLNTMDSSGVSIRFESLDEEDAKNRLQTGEIIGYFHLSHDFIEGLSRGENRPMQFVSSRASGALMYTLGKEVASTLTDLLVHSELAVYAMENYYTDHPDLGDIYKANEELNKKLIFGVLDRKNIYDVVLLDSFDAVDIVDYYIGAILVFYLLLSGLGMSILFASKDKDLQKLLYSRGISCVWQIFCEFLTAAILNLSGVAMILCGLFAASRFFLREIWVFQGDLPVFTGNILIVIILLSSMQFLVFEWIREIVPAMLLQFIIGLALCFASGILYPLSFFPKSMQDLAQYLPSRQAMLLIFEGLGYPVAVQYGYIIGFIVLFTALAIVLRYRWIKR